MKDAEIVGGRLVRLCSVPRCDRKHYAKSFCVAHFRQYQRGTLGDPKAKKPSGRERGPCSIEGCGRPHHARGLCDRHYRRLLRTGDPNREPTRKHPADLNDRLRPYLHCGCKPERGDVRKPEGWAAAGRQLTPSARAVFGRLYCRCQTERMGT